jgi:NADPH:quinone reductase-like Zn-dependent oxidoreductase
VPVRLDHLLQEVDADA